jgi:predicted transposase/invertase (TIGR01784 family)
LALHAGLLARILYTWSVIYHGLLSKGKDYTVLKPVIAIWLLNESVFPAVGAFHLPFGVMNSQYGLRLSDHCQIHVLQLPDWQLREDVSEELDRWMYLFREGEELDVDDPPVILQTEEMRQAMQVLQHFSENEREYLLYQSRLEAELVEKTWKAEITRVTEEAAQAKQQAELATQRAEQERREKEQAQRREEQERKEKERLLELLKQAGIDPTQQR